MKQYLTLTLSVFYCNLQLQFNLHWLLFLLQNQIYNITFCVLPVEVFHTSCPRFHSDCEPADRVEQCLWTLGSELYTPQAVLANTTTPWPLKHADNNKKCLFCLPVTLLRDEHHAEPFLNKITLYSSSTFREVKIRKYKWNSGHCYTNTRNIITLPLNHKTLVTLSTVYPNS